MALFRGRAMVFLYVLISLLGDLVTFAALSPYGWLIALVGALLCGNALVALAAVWVFLGTRQQLRTAAPDAILASIPQFSTGLSDLPEASPLPAAKAQKAA